MSTGLRQEKTRQLSWPPTASARHRACPLSLSTLWCSSLLPPVLVPPATMMLIPSATAVRAAGAMAVSGGRSCCGRGAPRGIKSIAEAWGSSPSLFTCPPGQPQPPGELHPKWEGATGRAEGKGGFGVFFFATFLLEAVFIPLVKCQMKSFRPKLVLSSSLRLFTL